MNGDLIMLINISHFNDLCGEKIYIKKMIFRVVSVLSVIYFVCSDTENGSHV